MRLALLACKTGLYARLAELTGRSAAPPRTGPRPDQVADVGLAMPERRFPTPPRKPGHRGAIELAGVWFRYAAVQPWTLRDVSLRIEPGECVAIAGPSGSGKTTLLKILMGRLTATKGELRVGGTPIDALGQREYSSRVGAVLRHDRLLPGSIVQNICFFDPRYDPARVEAAARIAAVHEEISALPLGYATPVGDAGCCLTNAQAQRLLLARALYKRPEILFLDEATSQLDSAREAVVCESIRALRCTRVVVARRPQSVASADRVVVLDLGVIRQDLPVSPEFAESFPRAEFGTR